MLDLVCSEADIAPRRLLPRASPREQLHWANQVFNSQRSTGRMRFPVSQVELGALLRTLGKKSLKVWALRILRAIQGLSPLGTETVNRYLDSWLRFA